MRILAVDTTGAAMSVAVAEDKKILGEMYADIGKKHSVTLMAAADALLKLTGNDISDMDAFAVAAGPGSFTGIRIGVAAVSAMAYAAEKPAYAVNTLDALLANAEHTSVRCAVMDARRGEVYTKALYGGTEIVGEAAMPLDSLLEKLGGYGEVMFMGDAASKYREHILKVKPDSVFAAEQFMLQHASSVCMCVAGGRAERVTHEGIRPHYLRKSQAERLKCERETGRVSGNR